VHLARSHSNIRFYDLDTCLLGHLEDPVVGGARYNNYFLEVDDTPGIGADIDPNYLINAESYII
jgi:L-alanine-DL-glutamate epimerase-like enolase superfamily enzyme